MRTKTPVKPNKSEVRRIISADIRKNGKITADYLKRELNGWTIEKKNFEKIIEPINSTFEKNKNVNGKIENFVDNDTIDQIVSNIIPSPQLNSRFKKRSKYSFPKGNRLMIRMAENLRIQKI